MSSERLMQVLDWSKQWNLGSGAESTLFYHGTGFGSQSPIPITTAYRFLSLQQHRIPRPLRAPMVHNVCAHIHEL